MDKKILLKAEPKLAKLFINSRKKDRVANAYLLYGNRNAPLKETAVYLAKSLSCEQDLLACDNCPSCKRFNNGIRPDFYLIDGEETTIKKDDIKSLESAFQVAVANNKHKSIISCGSAALPRSVFILAIEARVNTGPGETQTERIPYFAPYCAIDFVKPYISPAFDVGYSIPYPSPSAPVIEPILIIKPLFCARICESTACAK